MTTIAQALDKAYQSIDRFEAKLLLATLLGKGRTYLITHDQEVLDEQTLDLYESLIRRRQKGEPIPYITGTQEFYGRPFRVNQDVLIPRPDTETLIEIVLSLSKKHPIRTLLDMGTGSGCIAITLALELSNTQVTASDISQEALSIARENAATLKAPVRFFESDWFESIHELTLFDVIVSNPPYIHPSDNHLLNLTYEPASALTDGVDGLKAIEKIIQGAPGHLNRAGFLLLEHGWDQAQAVRSLFNSNLWETPQTIKDLAGNDRVTMSRLRS